MGEVRYPEILPEEVMKLLQEKRDLFIVDVREPNEWEEGHIPKAKHIPSEDIPNRLHELDSHEEIIMVCRSGNRSGKACAFLSERGYRVVNMTGGMKAWPGEMTTGK